ncbi:MAG: hypothetical protein RJA07_1669 [Bacteroidota bacterium]
MDGKQQILGSIFVQNLIFPEKNYRTPLLNPTIALYCNPNKALREIKKGLPIKNDEQSLKVQVEGLEPTHLTASDPKSDAAANFATPAFLGLQK